MFESNRTTNNSNEPGKNIPVFINQDLKKGVNVQTLTAKIGLEKNIPVLIGKDLTNKKTRTYEKNP